MMYRCSVSYRARQHNLSLLVQSPVNDSVVPTTSDSAPATVTWQKLCESPETIPELTIDNVMKYFVYLQDSDGLERQDWKSLSSSGGFKLFQEGHVQDLTAAVIDNVCHVKGKCLPEMKKDRVYPIDIYVDAGRNSITGAQCTCPAGHGPKGSCKHIAAACFALEDFVRLRSRILNLEDNDQISCTSLLQQWNKPRKRRLDSKMVEDISFVNKKFGAEPKRCPQGLYDPRLVSLRKTTNSDLKEFEDELNLLPTSYGFLHLSKPGDDG